MSIRPQDVDETHTGIVGSGLATAYSDPDKDNAQAEVVIAGKADHRIVIALFMAGYSDRNVSGFLTMLEGATPMFKWPVHAADGFTFPSVGPFAYGSAVTVRLSASGTVGKTGHLNVWALYIKRE